MGDRGQVRFIDGDNEVWFYTHWGASNLTRTVQAALKRGKSRWDDPEYLARIIFCEMVKGDVEDLLGYGIGFSEHGDVWQVVTVNASEQTVEVRRPEIGPISFEEYIAKGLPDGS